MTNAAILLFFAVSTLLARPDTPNGLEELLRRPILEADVPLREVQAYTAARIPPPPTATTPARWQAEAERLRRDLLDRVVFRGPAASWRDARTRVEWLELIEGGPG